jgi:hypothetical protein
MLWNGQACCQAATRMCRYVLPLTRTRTLSHSSRTASYRRLGPTVYDSIRQFPRGTAPDARRGPWAGQGDVAADRARLWASERGACALRRQRVSESAVSRCAVAAPGTRRGFCGPGAANPCASGASLASRQIAAPAAADAKSAKCHTMPHPLGARVKLL